MTKILVIDDEPAASNILKIIIEKNIDAPKEIKCCHSAQEGLAIIQSWQPHLLMLDIEMPNMNGFDLLSQFKRPTFHVIFTTAYDKYAIRAIKFSAFDYLLKPIDTADLKQAFVRYFNNILVPKPYADEQLENLFQNLKQKQNNALNLALSNTEGVHILYTPNIIYCEGIGNYTRFIVADKAPILVSKTIKEYEELLQEQSFFRVHKSFLVNTQHIRKYEKEGSLTMSNGDCVAVSRRKKEELKKLLSIKK